MASNMGQYIDSLDELRETVRDLDGMVEGGPEQAEAVAKMSALFQSLTASARLVSGDYRHNRDPYAPKD